MDKEILVFGDIEIEKDKFTAIKLDFVKYSDINNVLESNNIFLVKNTINNLLVTCMMIIKLSHYI